MPGRLATAAEHTRIDMTAGRALDPDACPRELMCIHPAGDPDLCAGRLTHAVDGTGVRHIPLTAEGAATPCHGGEHRPSRHPGPAPAPILTLELMFAATAGRACVPGIVPGKPECLTAHGVQLVPARREPALLSPGPPAPLAASEDSGSAFSPLIGRWLDAPALRISRTQRRAARQPVAPEVAPARRPVQVTHVVAGR